MLTRNQGRILAGAFAMAVFNAGCKLPKGVLEEAKKVADEMLKLPPDEFEYDMDCALLNAFDLQGDCDERL